MTIRIPSGLEQLLHRSAFDPEIGKLSEQVAEILVDNKLPFFPNFTDHGLEHINSVLASEAELIPGDVWAQSTPNSAPRLLSDVDAAVILGATLLHDIAMHIRPEGFLELVSDDTRFKPIAWFDQRHQGHEPDRPWPELWAEYQREARRFSDRDLADIIGDRAEREQRAANIESDKATNKGKDYSFQGLDPDIGRWQSNDYLIVGEFIRRHHARLAHEIAIHGFPGTEQGWEKRQFPALGASGDWQLSKLADLIGLTARSHGMNLRLCKAYLDAKYHRQLRPLGCAPLYPMALLRVADYLQIDSHRTPPILLQLRKPQSPKAIEEWAKHAAVEEHGPDSDDPSAKRITVSPNVGLKTYLQLRELIDGLQAELDHSAAVLSEAYGLRGKLGLDKLKLSLRRVYSNLTEPDFREALPFVPEDTGFAADPHLLTLLVAPLYGNNPCVGARELIQNAVDAVRELEHWRRIRGRSMDALGLAPLAHSSDVTVDYIRRDDWDCYLRVRDRGIGMTAETIERYFLRAGASFRNSREWVSDFVDCNGQPRVIRNGRFGIGVFAAFLLGPVLRLETKHASERDGNGLRLVVAAGDGLIEIQRDPRIPVGTTVEIELCDAAIEEFEGDPFLFYSSYSSFSKWDWFCDTWPKVTRRILSPGDPPTVLRQRARYPLSVRPLPPEWSMIRPPPFDAVYWTYSAKHDLVHNGIAIANPSESEFVHEDLFDWPGNKITAAAPRLAVYDSRGELPLTATRFKLANRTLPFEDALVRDVLIDIVAHAIVFAPSALEQCMGEYHVHPLVERQMERMQYHTGRMDLNHRLWCATERELIPADKHLLQHLGREWCTLAAVSLATQRSPDLSNILPTALAALRGPMDAAILPCHSAPRYASLAEHCARLVRDIRISCWSCDRDVSIVVWFRSKNLETSVRRELVS